MVQSGAPLPGEWKTLLMTRCLVQGLAPFVALAVLAGGLSGQEFRRGDANVDSAVDLSDGVRVLEFLFLGGAELSCFDAADTEDSGDLSINDAIFLFNALFVDGVSVPSPGDSCGIDPTPDMLDCLAYEPCEPPAKRLSNVLLIISDDLGVDSSGCYTESGVASTPNLATLCAGGVVFRNAWSYPVCSPTRASLLTGQYAFRTGIGDVIGGTAFPIDVLTLPRALDSATGDGVAHACVGKWHLVAGRQQPGHPNTVGFGHYSGALNGLGDYFSWERTVDGESETVDRYATSQNVDDALRWIDLQGDEPWFLWLAFNAPHTPFHLPPAGLHTSAGLSGDAQDIDGNPLPYYQAAIEAMDSEIGRLLASMDPVVRSYTNVVYVGDNGSPARVAVPARSKGTFFEGGIHVPLVISGPVVVDGGREVDAVVQATDLFATVLDRFGVDASSVPSEAAVDSVSLVPYLKDPFQAPLREWILAERFGENVRAAQVGKTLRNERFKLVDFAEGADSFYDLDADPGETDNLLLETLSTEAQSHFDRLSAVLEALLAGP
jgi:arylsulfatase B